MFFLGSFFAGAQTQDTSRISVLELQKQILSLKSEVASINMRLGYLKTASDDHSIGLAFNVGGAVLIAAGTLLDKKGIMAAGGLSLLVGFVCDISAWDNIRKAGK